MVLSHGYGFFCHCTAASGIICGEVESGLREGVAEGRLVMAA